MKAAAGHTKIYVGRFAPTPSGALHLGSLLTALASYLQARANQGRWLICMDDLDHARCIAGADREILRQLEAHGLHWDGAPRYQSSHLPEYEDALQRLTSANLTYHCTCSRAELSIRSQSGPDGPIYAGTCRDFPQTAAHASIRLKIPDQSLVIMDGWQGRQQRNLRQQIGDFVLRRADSVIAYQLACAVDEAAQSITEVVRGSDLLGSSFSQICVLNLLGLPVAQYRHLPVLTQSNGRKFSKQNHAPALRDKDAAQNLLHCLAYLGQACPEDMAGASPPQVLAWAITHWDPSQVPRQNCLLVE